MKSLELSGAVRPIYGSLCVKRIIEFNSLCKFLLKKLSTKSADNQEGAGNIIFFLNVK